jgi:putative ABC transport system permease protein
VPSVERAVREAVRTVDAPLPIRYMASTEAKARVREFGIRLALKASPRRLNRLVIRQGLGPVVAGLLAGVTVAWWVADLLANAVIMAQLYQTTPHDLVALTAAAAALVVTGAIACWMPARRTGRVVPVGVLKVD